MAEPTRGSRTYTRSVEDGEGEQIRCSHHGVYWPSEQRIPTCPRCSDEQIAEINALLARVRNLEATIAELTASDEDDPEEFCGG